MVSLFPSVRVARRRMAVIATAGAVTAISVLPFAEPAQAASGFQRGAYFIGADGSLDFFGSNSDGVWSQVTPLTPAKSAPAGVSVAAVRGPSGRLLAYYVGGDGAVYKSCDAARGSYTAVTQSGFAPVGSTVSATLVGSEVSLTVGTSGGFTSAWDDDYPPCGNDLHWRFPWPRPKWWFDGGGFTTIGYADGEVGVFQAGTDGAVHAFWGTSTGQSQEATLTGTGVASPGGGVAVTLSQTANAGVRSTAVSSNAALSPNASAPQPGATSVFYAGRDGRLYVEHPAANGLSDKPAPLPADTKNPAPWAAQVGALSAADGTTQVAYLSSTGALLLTSGVNGQWTPPKQVTGAGFGTAGGSLGVVGASADDFDIIYCGTPPGHIHIGPRGPVWTQAGSAGSAVARTAAAAVQ